MNFICTGRVFHDLKKKKSCFCHMLLKCCGRLVYCCPLLWLCFGECLDESFVVLGTGFGCSLTQRLPKPAPSRTQSAKKQRPERPLKSCTQALEPQKFKIYALYAFFGTSKHLYKKENQTNTLSAVFFA